MKRTRRWLLIVTMLSLSISAFSQPKKYWIFFTDKELPLFSKSTDISSAARRIGISERALQRRAKLTRGAALLSNDDYPVSTSYISQLASQGIDIEQQSRWLNAVSAYLSNAQFAKISSLPFVKSIQEVITYKHREEPKQRFSIQKIHEAAGNKYTYGNSATQMTTINAVAVHNIGVSGQGVLVGMLDVGYRWRTHEALKDRHVIAEYDFIERDSNTANSPNEVCPDEDSHGTSTFSTLAGFSQGNLIGPAFNAEFMLAKTEYNCNETHEDEDNWVAGIEWLEANGVDVVSCSLGYNTFDPGQGDYTYADMNGHTATTTKAAVIAARKGVLLVNSMGNEGGNSWKYMTSPADADSIISVGAVNSAGVRAYFSSIGPTSDGRIKPDVVAQGTNVYCAIPYDPNRPSSYAYYQGTSLSTPLVAGVAAMILSVRPELTPIQVREALRNTANNAATPNNEYGWGLIDAYKALLFYGMVISTDPEISVTQDSNNLIGMCIISKTLIKKDSVALYYSSDSGHTFTKVFMQLTEEHDSVTHSGKYTGVIPHQPSGRAVRFYVQAGDANETRTSPYNAPVRYYDLQTGTMTVPREKIPTTFALEQNFPNPFNPSTTIRYALPAASHVTIEVFNLLGQKTTTLVNEEQMRGSYEISFSLHEHPLPSGVYFYRLTTESFVHTKKMMIVK